MVTLSSDWKVAKPAVHSQSGIVSAQAHAAAEIGASILGDGGNAVDAAIATSFALGVAEPWMSGIGGGGYMVLHHPDWKEAKVVDFGMKTPAGLRPSDYPIIEGQGGDLFSWPAVKDDANLKGARAVAIPGQVAGMGLAHEAFGTLPWSSLVAPAAQLARKGLEVDWYCQLILSGAAADLAECAEMRRTFFTADGFPKSSMWVANKSTICNFSPLADTLEHLAEEGAQSFYKGPLAEMIVNDLQEAGGRHTLEDMSSYRPRVTPADRFTYRAHTVHVTPELTAGPTLRAVLRDLEGSWSPKGKSPDGRAYAAYERAIRAANEERYREMGDPLQEPAPSCTTHFNVVDDNGLMVSVTQTLLSIFGARRMLPHSGIIMNNGVMWMDPEVGRPNSIAPGKRCLSNMCPTILEASDGTFLCTWSRWRAQNITGDRPTFFLRLGLRDEFRRSDTMSAYRCQFT